MIIELLQEFASFLAIIFIVALTLFAIEWIIFGFVYSYDIFIESKEKRKKETKDETKDIQKH